MSKISELVALAKSDPTTYKEINFGNVPNSQAQSICAITGVEIRSAQKILSTQGIRHAFSTHGDHSQEAPRGQIGITDSDFERIPEILSEPDSVERANKSKKGDDGILFKKLFGHKLFHVVVNVKRGNREKSLTFATMYIKTKSR